MKPQALVLAPLLLALAGCGEDADNAVETLTVERGDFVISLRSKGELKAAESTPIKPPQGSRAPRTINWLAPNFSWVQAGDVVARFDVSGAEREASAAGIEIDKVEPGVVLAREIDAAADQVAEAIAEELSVVGSR